MHIKKTYTSLILILLIVIQFILVSCSEDREHKKDRTITGILNEMHNIDSELNNLNLLIAYDEWQIRMEENINCIAASVEKQINVESKKSQHPCDIFKTVKASLEPAISAIKEKNLKPEETYYFHVSKLKEIEFISPFIIEKKCNEIALFLRENHFPTSNCMKYKGVNRYKEISVIKK